MKTISLRFVGFAALLALGLNAGAGVAKIGTQEYDTLEDAIKAVKDGDVVQLLDNVEWNCSDLINASGFKVTSAGEERMTVTVRSTMKLYGDRLVFDGVLFHTPKSITALEFVNQNSGRSMKSLEILNCKFTGFGSFVNMRLAGKTTIRNCEFVGGYRQIYGYPSDGTLIENCKLSGGTYGVNFDDASNDGPGDVTVLNCELAAWNSYSGIRSMTFDGCKFRTGNYNCVPAYLNTTFVNCEFDSDFQCYAQTTGFTWTFTDCLFAGAPFTETVMKQKFEDSDVWNKCTVVFNSLIKEIEIEPVAKDESNGITQDVADEINNNTEVKKIVQSGVNDALANIDPAGEAVVKVNLEKVEKATDEAETPTLTFEVAPYVGNKKVEDVNKKLNGKKVTVVLPLTKAFTVSAIVTHEGDPDRLLPVLGLPNSPYVQLETTHFSLFGTTPSNQKVLSTEVDAKTVLGIKRVKEMSKSVDTAAAVPWLGAAGGNCKVSELITTGLAVGDTIKVYDLATKGYFTWVVDKDGKTWAKAEGVPESQPEADNYTLARGRAFWYMKDGDNASEEYTQVGTYSEDHILTATDKGGASAPVHNLLINPKWADFNASKSLVDEVTDGDQIVIVNTKVRYEFKLVDGVGKWGTVQPTEKKILIGGVERTVRGPDKFVPVEGDLVITAGTAFWYISKGGMPTVKW